MTEERKQELSQLLQAARGSLVIYYDWGGAPSSIPVDVYRRYLAERWRYYGIGFFSFAFSVRFTLDIADQSIRLRLLRFIREEFVPFIDRRNNNPNFECIRTAIYLIESDPTNGYHLYKMGDSTVPLLMVIERLLEISVVRGIEAAVSFFDRCSCGEGVLALHQEVAFLEGIKIKAEIPLFEGVRLVPLPSSNISLEVAQYVPGFSIHTFSNQGQVFFSRTLLVIDSPTLFTVRRLSEQESQREIQMDDLPFQVQFPNIKEIHSFARYFCQVLSLVCNSAVKIVITRHSTFDEEQSFDKEHGPGTMFRYFEPLGDPPELDKADIEKAKCLYKRLINLDTKDREKLQIAIDRWIESKTDRSHVDKMIDLGIAFESLYLSDIGETTELSFRLRLRAAWHLGKDKESRKELLKKFGQIYTCRSKAVHNGQLDKTVRFGGERIPILEFIESAQDLCRQSIIKMMEDGQFPDWNDLILGGEVESDVVALGENPGGLG